MYMELHWNYIGTTLELHWNDTDTHGVNDVFSVEEEVSYVLDFDFQLNLGVGVR